MNSPELKATFTSAFLAVTVLLISATGAQAQDESSWYDKVTVEFGATSIFQATSGNDYGNNKDQTDFAFSADLALIGEIAEGHTFNLVFEAGEGDGAAENIGSRATPDYDAIDTTGFAGVGATVAQVYYEGDFFDGKLSLAIGKMDVHAYTDNNEYANDETTQFLNGLFVRSIGVIFAEHSKYYVPTIAFTATPFDFVSIKYTYSHDGGEDFFSDGYHWLELGLHPKFGELSGNYRIAYVQHDIAFTDRSNGQSTSNAGMINVSVDQAITGNLGIFARYAAQDDGIAENEVVSAISGGVSVGGAYWGMDADSVGVAYGHLELNKDIVTINNDGESVAEAYYSHEINEHINITADVQMFSNLERTTNRDVTVFGIRMQAGF